MLIHVQHFTNNPLIVLENMKWGREMVKKSETYLASCIFLIFVEINFTSRNDNKIKKL